MRAYFYESTKKNSCFNQFNHRLPKGLGASSLHEVAQTHRGRFEDERTNGGNGRWCHGIRTSR